MLSFKSKAEKNSWLGLIKNSKFKPQNFFLALFFCFYYLPGYALSFDVPKPGNNIVGEVKTAIVRDGEDFSDIAARFDLGYYEVFEANLGVDPDDPPEGTVLIIPTRYILPPELIANTMVINLAELRLYYWAQAENKIYIFPIGIGKESGMGKEEDWRTPVGTLTIVEKIKDPKWVVPDSIMKFRESIGDKVPKVVMPGPDNPLGNYALRTSNTTILIHGTNVPEGIGRRSSAGCIRLYPNDIEHLFHLVKIGTPIKIINSPYKAGWFDGKLYLEAHLPLSEQRLQWGGDLSPAIHLLEEFNKFNRVFINWDKVTKVAADHLAIPQEVGR